MISTNSILPAFVNLQELKLYRPLVEAQFPLGVRHSLHLVNFPVSQASLAIGIFGAFAVEGFGGCAVANN